MTIVNSPDANTKVIDESTGAQVTRGGQKVGDSFFGAIQAAFNNLSYHPLSVALFAFGIFIIIAELGETHGPLEYLGYWLASIAHDPEYAQIIRSTCGYASWAVLKLCYYKITFAELSMVWAVWGTKPGSRSFTIAAIASAFVIFTSYLTVLEVIIISVLTYFLLNLRAPSHKIIVFVALIAIIGFGLVDMSKPKYGDSKSSYYTKVSDLRERAKARYDQVVANADALYNSKPTDENVQTSEGMKKQPEEDRPRDKRQPVRHHQATTTTPPPAFGTPPTV